MLSIQQLRELGGGLDTLTDEQIAQSAYQSFQGYYPDFNTFAKQVGYDPENDFGRGLRMGGRQTLAAGAGALAMGADMLGATGARDYLLDAARGQATQARQLSRQSDDVDNFRQDPLSFLSSGAGQAIAFAAPSLIAGGGLGLGLRVAGAGLGAQAAGAAAGAYGANFAQESGGIYNELAGQGRYEPGRAALYGAGAAVLDTASEALPFMRGAQPGRLLTRVGKGVGLQAGVEAGTEVLQTGIERAGAYQPLTGEDAYRDYRNAAALGALGGGMYGGVGGVLGGQRASVDPSAPQDLLNPIPAGTATELPFARGAEEAMAGLPLDMPDTPLPAGTATELPFTQANAAMTTIPTGEAYEMPPVGEAAEMVPTGEASDITPIPQGDTAEMMPNTQQELYGPPDESINEYPTQQPLPTPAVLRAQITERAGDTGPKFSVYASKLALDLAPVLHDAAQTEVRLAAAETALADNLAKLDKKVSGDSNMLTPEEYAQKRAVLDSNQRAIAAAREIAAEYTPPVVKPTPQAGQGEIIGPRGGVTAAAQRTGPYVRPIKAAPAAPAATQPVAPVAQPASALETVAQALAQPQEMAQEVEVDHEARAAEQKELRSRMDGLKKLIKCLNG